MTTRQKNLLKATLYVTMGIIVAYLATIGIIAMYFSGTFLPVYIGKTYVIGNRIVRYFLYVLLSIIALSSCVLVQYGGRYICNRIKWFLIKKGIISEI